MMRDSFMFYGFLSPSEDHHRRFFSETFSLSWKCYRTSFLQFLQSFLRRAINHRDGNVSSCSSSRRSQKCLCRIEFLSFGGFLTNFKCFIMFHFVRDIKRKVHKSSSDLRVTQQANEVGVASCMQ